MSHAVHAMPAGAARRLQRGREATAEGRTGRRLVMGCSRLFCFRVMSGRLRPRMAAFRVMRPHRALVASLGRICGDRRNKRDCSHPRRAKRRAQVRGGSAVSRESPMPMPGYTRTQLLSCHLCGPGPCGGEM